MPRCLLLCLLLVVGCAPSDSTNPTSQAPDHHTENGFRNLYIEDPDKSFFDFLRMRFGGEEEWADHTSLASTVPFQQVDLSSLLTPADSLQITWLGHSTFLLQHKGINILTDPMFADRASPFSFMGPKRYVPHVVDYDRLPPIDAVIISHNHYDHLDSEAIELLAKDSHFFVPLGIDEWLLDEGVAPSQMTVLDWWQSTEREKLSVQALPSQHWSARGLGDRFETLWASWLIRIDDYSIWFAGDTGYNPVQFKQIKARTDDIDLALIPIGAYEPRWFMQHYHVNPDEAVRMHMDVGAKKSIGMHWGTFPLTAEAPDAPPKALEKARLEHHITEQQFNTIIMGKTVLLEPQ